MSAIRLARAATGREKLLKFAGAYHGHVDGLLAEAGSGLATAGHPVVARRARRGDARTRSSCRGTTPTRSTRAVAEHEFAAILAEPFPANMGLVPPEDGFLELLRERATRTGALLVFDEVITGFRVARGGAQELTGVEPDLDGHGQGHRRRAARRGLRRAARPDGAHRARRRRLPGGHAVGQPARGRRRARDAALLDEQAYARLAATTEALAAGLREAAGERAGAGPDRPRPADRLLRRGARRATTRPPRPATSTPTRPGAARCWRAASTRRRRSSRPGSRRSPTRPSTSTRTVEAAAAAFAELAMSAREAAAVAAVREGHEPALRHGRPTRPTTPTSRCSTATASTPRASSAWPRRRPRGDRRARRPHLRLRPRGTPRSGPDAGRSRRGAAARAPSGRGRRFTSSVPSLGR